MSILDGKAPYLYILASDFGNPSREAEFNEFYDKHTRDLCTVPGILSGARYQERNAESQYIAGYELESLNVFKEQRYREITGWGGWESHLRGWRRAVFHVVKTFPEGPEFPGIG